MKCLKRKERGLLSAVLLLSLCFILAAAGTAQADVLQSGVTQQEEETGPGVSTGSAKQAGTATASDAGKKTESTAGQSGAGSTSGQSSAGSAAGQNAAGSAAGQSSAGSAAGAAGQSGPGIAAAGQEAAAELPETAATPSEALKSDLPAEEILKNISVTWDMGDRTVELEIGTFRDWIEGKNEDGTIKINEAALKGWVYAWFEPYRIRTFHCFDGRDVQLTGTLGWYTGPNAETEKALAALQYAVSIHRVIRVPADPSWGSTYVECDLNAQHVYFFRDGQAVWDSPCVSGMMTEERKTPEGLWAIFSKETDRDLKGTIINGQPSYISHVDYWMPFHNGCGLHDASWRAKFGGTIYVKNGSHGCVNLPSAKAAELYGLVGTGTPVVVHY